MNFLFWLLGIVLALIFSPFTGVAPHAIDAPAAPVYTCDSLRAAQFRANEFVFTTEATVKNGAEITNYTYDFGDGDVVTSGRTFEHVYATPGIYVVTVRVNVKLHGRGDKSVTSPRCTSRVVVKAP